MTKSIFRVGLDRMPLPMVLVRCRRCRRQAGQYREDSHGDGNWSYRDEGSCTCDPPVVLPQGDELVRLVKLARRRGQRADGKAPVKVTR
jgi:hypothetical protein